MVAERSGENISQKETHRYETPTIQMARPGPSASARAPCGEGAERERPEGHQPVARRDGSQLVLRRDGLTEAHREDVEERHPEAVHDEGEGEERHQDEGAEVEDDHERDEEQTHGGQDHAPGERPAHGDPGADASGHQRSRPVRRHCRCR